MTSLTTKLIYDFTSVIDEDSDYDYTESSRLLLEQLAINDLSLEQRIDIINEFCIFRSGEDYGGGDPCENTDCCRDFTSDYFIEYKVNRKERIGFGSYKRGYKIVEKSIYYCPSCNIDIDINEND